MSVVKFRDGERDGMGMVRRRNERKAERIAVETCWLCLPRTQGEGAVQNAGASPSLGSRSQIRVSKNVRRRPIT